MSHFILNSKSTNNTLSRMDPDTEFTGADTEFIRKLCMRISSMDNEFIDYAYLFHRH